MTRGAAATLRADPARQALAQLAAAYCVDRFEAAADAPKQLALLKKKTDSWQRDEFVDNGGWTKPPGAQKSVDGAADICARRLLGLTPAARTEKTAPLKPGWPNSGRPAQSGYRA